ncbi:diacylglycerol/lipid kinase family protein [Nocardia otitidiscaviarum]|uniref:diacylglycerol/lipid kinase family protein n=1 Tax=Nocardia otitidiscaviarum TaxID=1823 RepID=UPI002453EF9D|nr:diacylglycerol kinase family protein [Nocardia otitidiscaviarum]
MFLVVNPTAKGGAATRWPHVRQALLERRPDIDTATPDSAAEAEKAVRAAVDAGHDAVIAAGGDGTVGLVLNALMDPTVDRPRDPRIALGAIGLGSSNDFHKPAAADRLLAGVPARIDLGRARSVDVGKATMLLPDGTRRIRYFLLNASMGLVAAGNHHFNTAGGLTAWLKPRNTDAAIAYTALRTIATFDPLRVDIRGEGWRQHAPVTNVSVLKSVHFAGGMRYDTGVTADDGRFDVNIWSAASRPAVLRLIAGLYRGRFRASALARCERSARVDLRPEYPSPLELDGEITVVEGASLEVLPRALLVCA